MLANLYRVMFIVWHDSHFKFDFSMLHFSTHQTYKNKARVDRGSANQRAKVAEA
jgi:hypothetical protein